MTEIVRLTPDDAALATAGAHLLRNAFGGPERADKYRESTARDVVFAAVDGRDLLGVTSIRAYGQWFAGRSLPMGGIAAVAVAAHARRRGVARTLLTTAIEQMREDEQPVSALHPTIPPAYRSVGWEVAGELSHLDLPTARLSSAGSGRSTEVSLRALDRAAPADSDLAAVQAIYTEAARSAVGPLTRVGPLFDLAKLAELDGVVIASVGGVDAGYVSWSREDFADQPARLEVHDLIADRPDVRDALLGVVGSWQTSIRNTRVRLADPVIGGLGLPRGARAMHKPWMLRVVDAPAAVGGRGFGPLGGSVDLEITDPQAPWNDGRWQLTVTDGGGTLTRGGSGAVRLGPRGLAAVFTGYAGAAALRSAGLAEGDEKDLVVLAALFAGPTPWMLDDF